MKYQILFHICFLILFGTSLASQIKPSKSARRALTFTYAPNITRVTFDNPPINLFDANFAGDLFDFLVSIQPSESNPSPPPKVVIFDSADPDIFASHLDLNALIQPELGADVVTKLQDIVSFLRNTTTTTFITEVNGLAVGFGNEFLIQTDLRFAGPKTKAGQLENAAGVIVGAGGQQALPRLINRGRGLQYLLASEAVDGKTGAEMGWFNEYYDSAAKLRGAVDRVARRIALFDAEVLEGTKAGLKDLYPGPDVYAQDAETIVRLANRPEEQARIKRILKAGKNQTRTEFELGLPDSLLRLYK